MSGAPIKAGDMGMVVHRCCDNALPYGYILTVASVEPEAFATCRFCNHLLDSPLIARFGLAQSRSYPAAWLRRIAPLSDPEEHHHPEELPHELAQA